MRSLLVENVATGGPASRWTRVLSKTICCMLFTLAAFAQSDRGTITGSVTDPAAAVVPGARVIAKNVDNGAIFDTTTTATGNFTLPSLPVGKYTLTVETTGFKRVIHENIQVDVDQTLRIDRSE